MTVKDSTLNLFRVRSRNSIHYKLHVTTQQKISAGPYIVLACENANLATYCVLSVFNILHVFLTSSYHNA